MNFTRILAEGYGPGAWHGADIKAAIDDVSEARAFARPARTTGPAHNIAELTMHHAFYVHAVRGRLLGQAIEAFPLAGDDFFPLSGAQDMSWDAIRAVLKDQQARLVATVEQIEAGTLRSPLSTDEQLTLVLGITCHSAYHAGQVQLLKLHP
jgi:hypothetical protein